MNSPSIVACREIFDENSQPSAEEISDYACQLGIDPESETHLLPLARDGLMQALPPPWKAYFDEKLQSHYYYNEETKKTQWEHPLDHVYRELVKKARDASVLDDTCASVQELLTSEENTKNLERIETKVESDEDELITDSEHHASDVKENPTLTTGNKRPFGRPPLAPLSRLEKKLGDLRISPLRRSIDSSMSPKPNLVRNPADIISRPTFERPKTLFKQQSEIIDLKMHVLTSPEEENFSPLLSSAKVDKGLPLSGKGNMFLRISRSNLPSPDTEKSHLDSITKSDPPKGILREKSSDYIQRKIDSIVSGKTKQTASFDEDRKSVRFKLENLPEPTVSPGSNSSSEQNDGQSSIISAPAPSISSNPLQIPSFSNTQVPSFNNMHVPSLNAPLTPIPQPQPLTGVPLNSIVLSPIAGRPPIPPRIDSPRDIKNISGSEKDSLDSESKESRGTSPRRRLVKPPAAEYIKPGLFQKNFQKISDLVRKTEMEPTSVTLEEPFVKEIRPRSPLIPQINKISINLMESIDSETSIESPDREFANIDLNDFDDSNENQNNEAKSIPEDIGKDKSPKIEDTSEKSHSKTDSIRNINIPIPSIKMPKLDFTKQTKFAHSDSEDSKKSYKDDEPKSSARSNSIDIPKDLRPTFRLSPTPSLGSDRSPRLELNKPWASPLSTFKPLNKAITPIKSSESLGKSLSPRLDGVMLSQGKSSSDNVVVVYQFETQDESPKIKSPIPDMGVREMVERNKADERRRLELNLQKELEMIRVEFSGRERKMRAELQTELREVEEKFLMDKSLRLSEQSERHKREIEEALASSEKNHQQALEDCLKELENKYQSEVSAALKRHESDMAKIRDEYGRKLSAQKEQLEIDNERALGEVRDQLQLVLYREKARILEENRAALDALRDEHNARIDDMRQDYRTEVERLRSQHAGHLEELRARLAGERAARRDDRALHDKYRCLKEKYARLKHDVKISLERRNKRREMSMTTGSETEKSNSHKATQSLERCKEVNETSVSAIIEPEPPRLRINNNPARCDNETSLSESNAHHSDNNNEEWKDNRDTAAMTSLTSALKQSRVRRAGVAFREPPRRSREKERDIGVATDCQDSSDATTADERPKETVNGHMRRRFTRLKSASTSRLNYSPKRGEGWASPLESLRQQLRKLDDLEDQFPDLACQPAYSLRYPFAELGPVSTADTPELEFVRHRALVEREGVRRARAALRRRRAALRETRDTLSPHRAASEATTSEGSSGSETGIEVQSGGAVLRSLRALHADVRDIWRALDARKPGAASPETSSCNVPTTSQTRMTLSAPEPTIQDNSDSVAEKAKGLRAWLQTTP